MANRDLDALSSLNNTLALDDAWACSRLFESQVMAGSSVTKNRYTCLDSKSIVRFLENQKLGTVDSKEPLLDIEQRTTLKRVAEGLKTHMDSKCSKIDKLSSQVHGTDMQVDAFFSRNRAPGVEDEIDEDAIHQFLLQTATHYCTLDSSPQELKKLTGDSVLCKGAPSHVIIEVCITGKNMGHKTFQLAKNYLVCQNLYKDYRSGGSTPLLVLYLNGDIGKANEGVKSMKKALCAMSATDSEDSEDTQLNELVREVLPRILVLYTPFRNVYQVLYDIRADINGIRDGIKESEARQEKRMIESEARQEARLEKMETSINDIKEMLKALTMGKA